MKKSLTPYPRAVKGLPHSIVVVSDSEIADAASVSVGAVRTARCRGEFSTFKKLISWVNLHRLLGERKKV